jgi:hypothetical protein
MMNTTDAVRMFTRCGYDVTQLTSDEFKHVRNILLCRYHPDLGGDPYMAAIINASYDLIKRSFKTVR